MGGVLFYKSKFLASCTRTCQDPVGQTSHSTVTTCADGTTEHAEDASRELNIKHLHIKYTKTGILDHFFSELIKKGVYERSDFLKWINNNYDKESLKNNFKNNTLLDILINFFLKRE